ncbi:uncharacterized protein G2W53_001003 [Senna tora]|uniref:Uncharacterized protein n=1 Tax=Senna tora TaxID=362788 RepID=A0A834XGE6_9FABA|nr:uncharacterized protein G2W53_001003 [Senna tora]
MTPTWQPQTSLSLEDDDLDAATLFEKKKMEFLTRKKWYVDSKRKQSEPKQFIPINTPHSAYKDMNTSKNPPYTSKTAYPLEVEISPKAKLVEKKLMPKIRELQTLLEEADTAIAQLPQLDQDEEG